MASTDDVFKYIGISIDIARGVFDGVGAAIKAFSAGDVDEGFAILSDTMRAGDHKVMELHPRREAVYAKNAEDIDKRFPPAPVHARVFRADEK